MHYDVIIEANKYQIELSKEHGQWRCKVDGKHIEIDAVVVRPNIISLLIENRAYEVKREQTASGFYLWIEGTGYAVEVQDPRSFRNRRRGVGDQQGPKKLVAPMTGKIVRILTPINTQVEAGQGVVVVEAMKMQNEVKSPKKGIVRKLTVVEGATVKAGDVLAIVE
jgi:biotin carboxyl carrier protein